MLFVGRVVRDKGIDELIEAFEILNSKFQNLKLLIVGEYEEHLNPLKSKTIKTVQSNKNIIASWISKRYKRFSSYK